MNYATLGPGPAQIFVERADRRTFKERFCKHFHLSEEDFARRILRLCLHPPWSFVSGLLLRMRPGFFSTDLQIADQLGRITSRANFTSELRELRSDYARHRDFGFARKHLRCRLSSERLFRTAKEVWKD